MSDADRAAAGTAVGAAPVAASGVASVAARYDDRAAAHERRRDALATRARHLSWARLATFAALVVALSQAATGPRPAAPLALAAASLVAFVALVVRHGRAQEAARWAEALRQANEGAARRVRREWRALPVPRLTTPPPSHPYADDLNVVGRASLLQLVDAVSAYPGRDTLAGWLLAPAAAGAVRERQAAVAELAPMVELREALSARALLVGEVRARDVERFLGWAEGEPWLSRRPWLAWLARLLPVATVALLALQAQGWVPGQLWLLPLVGGLALATLYGRSVQRTLDESAASATGLRQHAALFATARRPAYASPRLVELRGELAGRLGSDRALERLERIMRFAELRYSATAHALVNAVTLWDLHVVAALEAWQRRAGRHARRWFAALGEVEALAALAGLRHDNPDWAFPEIVEGRAPLVEADALGHPLIADDTRVPNDVTIGPPGTFLMVTGSNMSGKSTLLRAVGANVVLALAGAPVCARRMRLPSVALYTSMRVQDALDEGVSLFMAELRRLKLVVDAARAARASGTVPVLYLLDEILHGTNTAERQVAARRIIGHLIDEGAIGAVSTHDLTLGEGELAARARAVHFSERFVAGDGGPVMTFDYRLRPGVATSVNALKLVELMGLG
jgi:ABC-type multidrug transport system fused ATPase/permease subunit